MKLALHNHTEPSLFAAACVTPAVTTRQRLVLCALEQYGPMTQDQISERLGWPIQSVNPRVNELARDGRIRETGERRRTRSGKPAAVWELTNDK